MVQSCFNPDCVKDALAKYCSRSCAAIVNNRLYPKRSKAKTCEECGCPVNNIRNCCDECLPKVRDRTRELSKERRRKANVIHVTARRKRLKQIGIEFLGGKCRGCGYNKYSGALVFHHTDPRKKTFTFGNGRTISEQRLKEELSTCVLLCLNCHQETHSSAH